MQSETDETSEVVFGDEYAMRYPTPTPVTPEDYIKEQRLAWSERNRRQLRDQFAMHALGAAWQGFDAGYYEGDCHDIAKCAYQIADAMMRERDN